jgi:ATP-binding cassette subfamily B (MDR/TAP) protein 1
MSGTDFLAISMEKEQTDPKDEKKKQDSADRVSLIELFKYATVYDCILMILATIASIAHGATLPLMTIFFGDIITSVVLYDGTETGKILLDQGVTDGVIKMCIIGASTLFFSYFQMCFWMLAGENQAKRVRQDFFKSVIRQDIGWFDTMSTGDLTNRLTADMNVIQEGISDKVGLMIQFTSTFVAGFVIAYIRGWQLALVLTGTLPVLAGMAMILGKILASGSSGEQNAYAEAGSIAQQVISSIKTVVAFGGESNEIKRYCEKLDKAEKFGIKKAIYNGIGIGSIQFVMFCVYALAFWYGSTLVPVTMSAGQVLNVIFAIIIGAFSLGNATPHISSIGAALGAAKTIFDIIERKSSIDPLSESGEKPSSVKGSIEFKNISFKYPTRPDVTVLKNFNLTIEPGQSVALVGSSGSGKSSIIKLFERFYDPVEGKVLVDDTDIKTLNVKWLRQQIGIVSQEPTLFDTTIRENILLGLNDFEKVSNDSANQLIRDACVQANCWDFIQELPLKLDTKVGEAGTMLSGGQKVFYALI